MRSSRRSLEYVQIRRLAAAWLIDASTGGPRPKIKQDLTPRLLRRAWQLRREIECVALHDLILRLAAVQCNGLDDYCERVKMLSTATRWRLMAIYRGVRQQGKTAGRPIRTHAAEVRESLITASERNRYTLPKQDYMQLVLSTALGRQTPGAAVANLSPEERLDEEEFADVVTHVIHVADDVQVSKYNDKKSERDHFRLSIARPLKVAGPRTEHEVDELFAALYAETPWMREVIEFLWRSARENTGDPLGFRLPPVVLVGPPGCGKTHLARRLGKLSGCDPLTIDMTSASSSGMIAGVEYTWNSAHPGGPLRHIEARRIANPLVVLDELEKRSVYRTGDPVAALLPMLQPETARAIYNPWLQANVDLSRISWVMLANDSRMLPAPLLDRTRVFHVELPRGQDLRLLVGSALGDVAEPEIIEIAATAIEQGRMSMRGLQRIRSDIERAYRRPLLQ